MCAKDNAIRYIPVTNEAELPGICARTYLAGKKGLMGDGEFRTAAPASRSPACLAATPCPWSWP
jgi:hypothetical protein